MAAGSARRYLAGPVALQWRGESAGLAGFDTRSRPGERGNTARKSWSRLSSGLLVLICADVIRPSLGWLLNTPQARRNLAVEMARTRDPAAFAELDRMCGAGAVGAQVGQQALVRIGDDHGRQGRHGR